ncbi:MAG TPA: hypothetical protein VEO54_32300 [Thermoanaerobaculia bacterium]|nr:hypothetical protein [Thermoanaerobaculia bacterium]
MPGRDVGAWIESGELEGEDNGKGMVMPWPELASFALELWSQETVEGSLGTDVADVLPELLRLTDLDVRIPRMHVVTLERLASRDGKTVSAVLARELRDLVSEHAPWLSAEVPGFAAACDWPELPGAAIL